MKIQHASAAILLLLVENSAPAALAQTAQDDEIIALAIENDLFANSDRHYTNGIRAGYSPPADFTSGWFRRAGRRSGLFPGDAEYRTAFTVGQNMYTPRDITARVPDPVDRPYAGWLYGSAALIGKSGDRLHSLEVSLGVVGPASLADETQGAIHDLIGADEPRGWEYQIGNEPAVVVTYQRRWLAWERQAGPLEIGFSPHLGGALGNVFTYANVGATIRLGQNAGSDFGPPRIQPAVPGTGVVSSDRFGWYVFASAEGRAVARNIFLDGNSFRTSPSVVREELVGDVQAGIVFQFRKMKIGYTHVFRTDEFESQSGNTGFGAFSLSVQY